MEKELLLLRKLHLNPKLTQRDMARATGLSLGSINVIIKKMLKMGIIEVEKTTQKGIRYHLTSLGIEQKAEGTYKYILEIYTFLEELEVNIDNLLNNIEDGSLITLFGEKDYIFELIRMKLNKNGTEYIVTENSEEVKKLLKNSKLVLIVWQPDKIKILNDLNFKCINLLNCI